MLKKLPISTVLAALLLSGCGSDSDNKTLEQPAVPALPTPESSISRPHPNLEIVGKPANTALDGKLGVRIGAGDPMILDLNKIDLPTTRPDIFAEGQHSFFDVLRYLDEQGLVDLDWDGTINEDDTVTFSVNGDPDWWFKFYHNSYRLETMQSEQMKMFDLVEYTYNRIDQALIKNGSIVQFLSTPTFTPELRKVRESENTRAKFADTHEVVVPKVHVHMRMRANMVPGVKPMPDLSQPDYTIENVKVKAFDLRTDLFQPGTVTMADVFATIATTPEYADTFAADEQKVQLVYWPTLKIGTGHDDEAEVEAYAVTQIAGKHEDTLAAWALFAGEIANRSDFGLGGGKKCFDPSSDYHNEDGISAEFCGKFGGHLIHTMADNRPLRDAPEEIHLFWYDLWNTLDNPTAFDEEGNRIKKKWSAKEEHYQYYIDPTNPKPEGFDVPDIADAIAPLDNTHFGWGVADCGQCHSVQGIHAKGDTGERFDMVRPHECAECHSSNGAPQGHDMEGRCFWCHQSVRGHRDMDKNNDFLATKSDVLPDPYSCATCHKNPQDGITNRAITKDIDITIINP